MNNSGRTGRAGSAPPILMMASALTASRGARGYAQYGAYRLVGTRQATSGFDTPGQAGSDRHRLRPHRHRPARARQTCQPPHPPHFSGTRSWEPSAGAMNSSQRRPPRDGLTYTTVHPVGPLQRRSRSHSTTRGPSPEFKGSNHCACRLTIYGLENHAGRRRSTPPGLSGSTSGQLAIVIRRTTAERRAGRPAGTSAFPASPQRPLGASGHLPTPGSIALRVKDSTLLLTETRAGRCDFRDFRGGTARFHRPTAALARTDSTDEIVGHATSSPTSPPPSPH